MNDSAPPHATTTFTPLVARDDTDYPLGYECAWPFCHPASAMAMPVTALQAGSR